MVSKRELLKTLVGKQALIAIGEAGIGIELRPSQVSGQIHYDEITEVGDDIFETIRHINHPTKDAVKFKIFYSIDQVVHIACEA